MSAATPASARVHEDHVMFQRIFILATIPVAAIALQVSATPLALAETTQAEDCDDARTDYCYGEGGAFEECTEMASEADRKACIKSTLRLCEGILVRVCEQLPGGSGSSGGGGGGGGGNVSYAVECPPGTAPDELGRCVARLQQREDGPDLDPTDWCPAGWVPGPNDECVPALHTVRFVPSDAGGWGVVCPPGSKPGPVDGCVLDLGNGGGEGSESPCPPGFVPGPDDRCVPRALAANLGNVEGTLTMDALNLSGTLAQLPELGEAALAEVGVATTVDPEYALMATAEAFGAELVDPDTPMSW